MWPMPQAMGSRSRTTDKPRQGRQTVAHSVRRCEKIALWHRAVGATLVVAPGRPQGPPLQRDFFTPSALWVTGSSEYLPSPRGAKEPIAARLGCQPRKNTIAPLPRAVISFAPAGARAPWGPILPRLAPWATIFRPLRGLTRHHRPCRGSGAVGADFPTACAMGYDLPPATRAGAAPPPLPGLGCRGGRFSHGLRHGLRSSARYAG
jgi:hypothetical protein